MITKPLPHTEASKRIAALPRVSREVMDGMLPQLKAYAFTVTGLDVGDQMARVQDSIAAVPAGQKTWDESKKEIAAELADALGGKQGERRAELLLRTHVFRSYAATRFRLLMEQRDVFPFWQYKTHGDGNVRPSHMALNGKIFPAGHDIWQRIFPPWDWGCRCLVVPLTAGAVRRMQDAGMEPQANEDDTLLKTQIVRPEVFDPRMADVIEKGQRLPSGESLNPSPSWSGAPWSIPGNIRHDWPLIEARYKDQPEVLEAFREWAGKTELPDLGMTVGDWVSGGAARFAQTPRKSRFGVDVLFDFGEAEMIRSRLTTSGTQSYGAPRPVPPPVLPQVEAFEAETAGDSVENGAVWSEDGTLRERRRSPRKNQVALTESALKDGIMSHNHPGGGPPSLADVSLLLDFEMKEVRVVTTDSVFRVQPGPRAARGMDLESLPGFDQQLNGADILARETQSGMGWSDDDADSAVQHSVLAWLADQGIIRYERIPRT